MTINTLKRKYHYDLDKFDMTILKGMINTYGFEDTFNKCLTYINCTRTMDNGMRIIQTIGEDYRYELTRIIYLAEHCPTNGDEELYFNKILEVHKNNIEFEKQVEPIIYDKAKFKKGGARKSKNKEGDMFPEETKKAKISKAEAKLKAKLLGASVGFGSFKLKKD